MLSWDPRALQALEMALKQAPVPSIFKGRLRKQLEAAAEAHAREHNHSTITAEDLVNGLMAKLPPNMQQKAQELIKKKLSEN